MPRIVRSSQLAVGPVYHSLSPIYLPPAGQVPLLCSPALVTEQRSGVATMSPVTPRSCCAGRVASAKAALKQSGLQTTPKAFEAGVAGFRKSFSEPRESRAPKKQILRSTQSAPASPSASKRSEHERAASATIDMAEVMRHFPGLNSPPERRHVPMTPRTAMEVVLNMNDLANEAMAPTPAAKKQVAQSPLPVPNPVPKAQQHQRSRSELPQVPARPPLPVGAAKVRRPSLPLPAPVRVLSTSILSQTTDGAGRRGSVKRSFSIELEHSSMVVTPGKHSMTFKGSREYVITSKGLCKPDIGDFMDTGLSPVVDSIPSVSTAAPESPLECFPEASTPSPITPSARDVPGGSGCASDYTADNTPTPLDGDNGLDHLGSVARLREGRENSVTDKLRKGRKASSSQEGKKKGQEGKKKGRFSKILSLFRRSKSVVQ